MSRSVRLRLDRALVERGLVDSRQQAAHLIDQGVVLVSGSVADKPARLVASSEPIELAAPPSRYVGRGGEKLDAALDRFDVDVRGRRVLDAGASTGGFTDCLLQAGAASVVAVDVGHGQLHQRLRGDPRVTVLERTDIRAVSLATLGNQPVEVVTADLSFISVSRVAATLVGEVALPGSTVIILAKPQFEAGRVEVSRGKGIIRDPVLHRRALGDVADALASAGARVVAVMPSPITGAAGNIEFLIHARTGAGTTTTTGTVSDTGAGTGQHHHGGSYPAALLDAAVAEAHRTDLRR